MRRQSGIDRAKCNTGKADDELLTLISKQVQDHGISKMTELRGRQFAEHEAAGVDGGHDFDFADGS